MSGFAGGRWTESKYKQFIRSALRKATMKWPPISDCLESARRPSELDDKRTKWEYQCASCEMWFRRGDVQVDHKVEVGGMDDMNQFVGRMFCEEDGLQVVCKGCHRAKGLKGETT